jgi:hypothetical protein
VVSWSGSEAESTGTTTPWAWLRHSSFERSSLKALLIAFRAGLRYIQLGSYRISPEVSSITLAPSGEPVTYSIFARPSWSTGIAIMEAADMIVSEAVDNGMTITIDKQGRRYYLIGDTFLIKDVLRDKECRFDTVRKAWWTGKRDVAERLAVEGSGRWVNCDGYEVTITCG